jgi:hypothetical protein
MTIIGTVREALKKPAGDGQAKRNQLKNRSLLGIKEHIELDSNTARLSTLVSQNFLSASSPCTSFITI